MEALLGLADRAFQEIPTVHAELSQFAFGEIHPAEPSVLPNVSHDVGQLEGNPAFLRERERVRRFEAEDVNRRHSDDRRRLVAIAVEIVERTVERLEQVAFHPCDQLEEVFLGNFVPVNSFRERRQDSILALTALQGIGQLASPLDELFAPHLDRLGVVVGDVVGSSHERVDRAHRVAFGAGQERERVVEVPGPGFRDFSAVRE